MISHHHCLDFLFETAAPPLINVAVGHASMTETASSSRTGYNKAENCHASYKRSHHAANLASPYLSPFPTSNVLLPFSWLSWITTFIRNEPSIKFQATFDPITKEIAVTDAVAVQSFWQQGFFGKGTLSRSEPTWWIREQNRQGANLRLTAEEMTALRRVERRIAKQEKAAGIISTSEASINSKPKRNGIAKPWSDPDNAEHLALDPNEAFYLIFALGILELRNKHSSELISLHEAFVQFMFPLQAQMAADNDALVHYVVYHHFRSLGWVVRSGVKFCVDFVLYKGSSGQPADVRGVGPPGGHAEFSVLIRKCYEDPEEQNSQEPHQRDWQWLSTSSRVTSGVKKVSGNDLKY